MTPYALSRAASAAGRPIPVASHSLPPDCRGRLKNGNPSGDFLAAPRCAARTRCGLTCRQPAMPNGRCRMHGGLSTGPRTAAGLANSRRARWKHGARSAEIGALRREARRHLRRVRALLSAVRPSAGHGVHRPNPQLVGAGLRPAPSFGRVRCHRDVHAPHSPLGLGFIVHFRMSRPGPPERGPV